MPWAQDKISVLMNDPYNAEIYGIENAYPKNDETIDSAEVDMEIRVENWLVNWRKGQYEDQF